MSDGGYTATEALAALAILGLAIGGLTSGLKVLGRGEAGTGLRISQATSVRAAGSRMAGLLREEGPFRSDDANGLIGDSRSLSFPCGASTCGAQLTETGLLVTPASGAAQATVLDDPGRLQFSYVGSQSLVATWPAAPPSTASAQWQVLRAILISDTRTGEVVLRSRVVAQQTANCQYDGILRDCQKVGE